MDEMLTADPQRGDWVQLAVNPRPGTKSLEWRFCIDGELITIEDGEPARSLAAELGWDFERPDELQQAA
jgi:hypothetical protein